MNIRFDPSPARHRSPWGVWWNVYRAGFTGRPKQRSEWFATEAEAKEFKARTLAALAANAPVVPVTPPTHWHKDSLAALAPEWLAEVKQEREAATHQNYAYVVKNWLAPPKGHRRHPGLGNLIVSNQAWTTKVVVDYLKALHAAGVSLSMRKRVKTALSALASYAIFAGRLAAPNPCAQTGRTIKKRGEAQAEAQPNPFTPEEIVRFFEMVASEPVEIQAYFQFQYDVGARPGETAALRWSVVDLDRQRAHIEASYSTVAKADKDTKTHETRWVDLTDRVVELLRLWYPIQLQEALRRGLPRPAYVFTSRSIAHHTRELGRYKQSGNIQMIFARLTKVCAITEHTLYDFRDSFATSHLVRGWDRKLPWVSKQLGHKTPLTTAKFYYAYRDTRETAGFANEIRDY